MLNAGAMWLAITIQSPVDLLDSTGAPYRSWISYHTCHAATEGAQTTANESNSSPYESATRTVTFIIRNHVRLDITTDMRIIVGQDSSVWAITSIRYDTKRSVCYVDATSGAAKG
jgi:head-tail adaptor